MKDLQKKMKKKIIGVTLDDVLRNVVTKFVTIYNETYPDKIILDDEVNKISPYKLERFFDDVDEMNQFLYEDNVFDIYGLSDETVKNIVQDLSYINEVMSENGYEIIIISKERNKSIPSTLHFLSKTMFKLTKIVFVDDYKDMLKNVDYLVTTSTFFNSRNKKIIKVEREYNKKYKTKLKIKEVKYLPQILEQINN